MSPGEHQMKVGSALCYSHSDPCLQTPCVPQSLPVLTHSQELLESWHWSEPLPTATVLCETLLQALMLGAKSLIFPCLPLRRELEAAP